MDVAFSNLSQGKAVGQREKMGQVCCASGSPCSDGIKSFEMNSIISRIRTTLSWSGVCEISSFPKPIFKYHFLPNIHFLSLTAFRGPV